MDKLFGEVSREEWGAIPRRLYGELTTPVQSVRFVIRTFTERCSNKDECIRSVKAIQKCHINDWGLPDINLHFLVGEDNNVYEGRGWSKPLTKMPNHATSKVLQFLTIGYIGDYTGMQIPSKLLDTAYDFIRYYVKLGKIHPTVLKPPPRIKLSACV